VSKMGARGGTITGVGCALALMASLVLARVHPFGDAGLYDDSAVARPLLTDTGIPPNIQVILAVKCGDCHSNQTRAPFYGHLAPASWLMERDIVDARKAMNLSHWAGYSADQQQTLAAKIAQEIKSRDMPPLQYRIIHWNAKTTATDLAAVTAWAHGMQAAQAGLVTAETGETGTGDAQRGQALFEKRCTGCHALDKNKQGPNLQGVYGRTSGTAAAYAYSDALKKAAIAWDEKSLDKWLTDPDQFISGNNMDFLVARPQERADLIAYLRRESGK
jgi:cytochrome c